MPTPAEERRLLLRVLASSATLELRTVWNHAAATDDFAATLAGMYPPLVDAYAQVAADLAGDWFEESTGAAPKLPPLPDPDAIDSTVEWALGAEGEDGLTRLGGNLQRMVFDGARATIIASVAAHGLRWERIAEPDACDYCQSLAHEYPADFDAGFEAHDHCQCMAVEISK